MFNESNGTNMTYTSVFSFIHHFSNAPYCCLLVKVTSAREEARLIVESGPQHKPRVLQTTQSGA